MNLELDVPALGRFIEKHGPIEYEEGDRLNWHRVKGFVLESPTVSGDGQWCRYGLPSSNFNAISIATMWLKKKIREGEKFDGVSIGGCKGFWVTVYFTQARCYEGPWRETELTALIAAYEAIESEVMDD